MKGPMCSWLVHLSLGHRRAGLGTSSVRWSRGCCLYKSPENQCWTPWTFVWGSRWVHCGPGWFQSHRLCAWRPHSGWEVPYRLLATPSRTHGQGTAGNQVENYALDLKYLPRTDTSYLCSYSTFTTPHSHSQLWGCVGLRSRGNEGEAAADMPTTAFLLFRPRAPRTWPPGHGLQLTLGRCLYNEMKYVQILVFLAREALS